MKNFQSNLSKSMKVIGGILGGIVTGKFIKDSVNAAMSVESSITQLGRIMGTNANEFEDWAKTQAKAFGMAREDAFKYGAVYSNLISTFSSGTKETTQYTTDLLKASAVVASATGRTMEDTMERIRSGLLGNTEAIEDLGINVNVAMLESTEAFKQFAKGRSWQQLAFQEQQQIRLMAILEQANTKYGESLAGTTATRQMMFLATLKNIRLNLGQTFLPIYNVILPALTSLANKIEYVTRVFAQFAQALFGKSTKAQAKETQAQANAVSELGDATEEAGKQAKGAIAGFDEINQLSMNDGSAGSGAVGGIEDVLDEVDNDKMGLLEEVSTEVQEMANKVKKAFSVMSSFIKIHKQIIEAALTGLALSFATFWIATNWSKIAGLFATASKGIIAAITGLSAPILAVAAVVGILTGAFVYFYKTNDKFRDTVNKILQKIGEVAQWLWEGVMAPFGKWLGSVMVSAWDKVTTAAQWLWKSILVPFGNFLKQLWTSIIVPIASAIKDNLAVAFSLVAETAKMFWLYVLVPLGNALSEMFKPAVEAVSAVLTFLWKNVFAPFGDFIKTIIMPIIQALIDIFIWLRENALVPLANFVKDVLVAVFEQAFITIGEVVQGIKKIFIGFMDFITGVFTGDWKKAWTGIKDIFSGIWETMERIFKGVLNSIIGMLNKFIDFWNSIELKVPEITIPFVGTVGGFTVSVPKINNIPKLARGGIVDSPTLAMIGEQGKEAVIPLENTAFVDNIASAIGTAVMTAMQVGNTNNSQDGDIVIQIEGSTLARVINPYLAREKQRLGNTILQTL